MHIVNLSNYFLYDIRQQLFIALSDYNIIHRGILYLEKNLNIKWILIMIVLLNILSLIQNFTLVMYDFIINKKINLKP